MSEETANAETIALSETAAGKDRQPSYFDDSGQFYIDGIELGQLQEADRHTFKRLLRRHQVGVQTSIIQDPDTGQILIEKGQGTYTITRMPDNDENPEDRNPQGRVVVLFSRDPEMLKPQKLTNPARRAEIKDKGYDPDQFLVIRNDAEALDEIDVVANFESPDGEENPIHIDNILTAIEQHHASLIDNDLKYHYLYRTAPGEYVNDAVHFRSAMKDSRSSETTLDDVHRVRIILGDGYGSALQDINYESRLGKAVELVSEWTTTTVGNLDTTIRPMFAAYSEAMRYGFAPSQARHIPELPDIKAALDTHRPEKVGVFSRALFLLRGVVTRNVNSVYEKLSDDVKKNQAFLPLLMAVGSTLAISAINFFLRGPIVAGISIASGFLAQIAKTLSFGLKREVKRSDNVDRMNMPGKLVHHAMRANVDLNGTGPLDPAVARQLVVVNGSDPDEEITLPRGSHATKSEGRTDLGYEEQVDPLGAGHGSVFSLMKIRDNSGEFGEAQVMYVQQPGADMGQDLFYILSKGEFEGRRKSVYARLRPDMIDKNTSAMKTDVREMWEELRSHSGGNEVVYARFWEDEDGDFKGEALSKEKFIAGLKAEATFDRNLGQDVCPIARRMSIMDDWADKTDPVVEADLEQDRQSRSIWRYNPLRWRWRSRDPHAAEREILVSLDSRVGHDQPLPANDDVQTVGEPVMLRR